MSGFSSTSFEGLGTTISVVVSDPFSLERAMRVTRAQVDTLNAAASRFLADSELQRLNAAAGMPTVVSSQLLVAIEEALEAARTTDGLVDPTVGGALELCGYDRDFAAVEPNGAPLVVRLTPVPGWRTIAVDRRRRRVSFPKGVRLDLGATAKAGCADRTAHAVAAETGAGVLISMGGDIAVAGPIPPEGWSVRVADVHDAGADDPSVLVALSAGGLATSGTAARRWQRGAQAFHHLIDPATGRPAETCWRTATVVAESCVRANTAATAAMVLGTDAPRWLAERGCIARLVDVQGSVTGVGGWPTDALVATGGMSAR